MTLVIRSLPHASSYLSNTVDLISLGLLRNATVAINIGCTQAILANTSVYDFENITTAPIGRVACANPPLLLESNHVGCEGCFTSKTVHDTLARAQFSLQVKRQGRLCQAKRGILLLGAFISQRSVKVGGNLVIQGSLLQNSTGIAGDTISFYLNWTYIANSRTGTNGSYYANVTVPYVYAVNASIWAVVSQNSSRFANSNRIQCDFHAPVLQRHEDNSRFRRI